MRFLIWGVPVAGQGPVGPLLTPLNNLPLADRTRLILPQCGLRKSENVHLGLVIETEAADTSLKKDNTVKCIKLSFLMLSHRRG